MFTVDYEAKAQEMFNLLTESQRKKILETSCKETVQLVCQLYSLNMNESLANTGSMTCPVCKAHEKMTELYGKTILSTAFLHEMVEEMDPLLMGMIRIIVIQSVYSNIITEIESTTDYSVVYAEDLATALSNIWVLKYTDELLEKVVKVVSLNTMIMDSTSIN